MHLVDSHPSCPTNSFGQPVIVDNSANVPWKQSVYMQVGELLLSLSLALFLCVTVVYV